jgi:hypothetical protein
MPVRRSPVLRGLLLAALAVPVLGGCAGVGEAPEDEPTTSVQHSAGLHSFFDGLASHRPARLREARSLTEPGSAAHKYASFELALAAARHDDGVRAPKARVVTTDPGYDVCGPAPGRRRCFQFTDLQVRGDHVVGFDVDGDDVADNLSVGSGRPEDLEAGGSVEFLSSYLQPSTGDYWVLFRVRADREPIRLNLGRARYARVGGEVLRPVTRTQHQVVAAGRAMTAVLVFPEADVGGTVQLDLRVGRTEQPVNLGTAPFVPRTPSG